MVSLLSVVTTISLFPTPAQLRFVDELFAGHTKASMRTMVHPFLFVSLTIISFVRDLEASSKMVNELLHGLTDAAEAARPRACP